MEVICIIIMNKVSLGTKFFSYVWKHMFQPSKSQSSGYEDVILRCFLNKIDKLDSKTLLSTINGDLLIRLLGLELTSLVSFPIINSFAPQLARLQFS